MAKVSDGDAKVLAALREAGSRLDQPHRVRHFLYFPDRAAAEDASTFLRREGFGTSVETALGGLELVLATQTVVPTTGEIAKVRAHFETVAKKFRGEYDGWE